MENFMELVYIKGKKASTRIVIRPDVIRIDGAEYSIEEIMEIRGVNKGFVRVYEKRGDATVSQVLPGGYIEIRLVGNAVFRYDCINPIPSAETLVLVLNKTLEKRGKRPFAQVKAVAEEVVYSRVTW